MASPRIAILVGSAGLDPWVKIEKEAQRPILLGLFADQTEIVWFEANSDRMEDYRGKVLAWIMQRQLDFAYKTGRYTRKAFKHLWSRWAFDALGSSKLRRYSRTREDHVSFNRESDRYTFDYPPHMSLQGPRTIVALRTMWKDFEFDYLLRLTSTCLSSPMALEDYVRKLPSTRVFAGQALQFAGRRFNSGAAFLMSRDVVEAVVAHGSLLRNNVYEDVALSDLISRHDIADFFDMPRIDVNSAVSVAESFGMNTPQAPVIRCKAERLVTTQSEPVVEIMRSIAPYLR